MIMTSPPVGIVRATTVRYTTVIGSTVVSGTVASQVAGDRDSERRQAWRDVFEAHAAIMELLLTEMKDEVGISITEYDVLLHLSEMPKPVRMNELADALVISKGGLTRVVDRMEKDGLLKRVPIAGDRRSMAIAMTRDGEGVF